MKRLRVAINAQLMPDGPSGGAVTALRALAALAELEDGDEEYVFIGPYEDPEWMRPLLLPGSRIVAGPKFGPAAGSRFNRLESFKRRLGPLRPVARGIKQFVAGQAQTRVAAVSSKSDLATQIAPSTPRSFFQSLECDVIHFPFQSFEACGVPSVFNPHDLQHLHFSEFFTPAEISRRENLYPAACRAAHTVVVASQFVKRDVVERYGVESKRVQVIPWAPPPLPQLPKETDEVTIRPLLRKYKLADGPFALYPAMTWEHKNHLRLLEAVAYLRDREALDVRVICTGSRTDFWPRIERRLNELGLNDVVKFPGLVPFDELNALYRAAQFVFVPTLFEAASAPVFEAWQHGAAVACSTVTSLPEQVADAAFLFDPFSVQEIASALARMTTDLRLREDLRLRGTRRLKDFSLERTAKAYRAVYRQAAGRRLNEEDREILEWDWMQGSGPEIEVRG
ncbi:MAG: glycosyltransferase family 1 protein [Pyrinomonadaceae bacterium]